MATCSRILAAGALALAALHVPAHAQTSDADIRRADAESERKWAYSVGVQNYVYGLPLMILERERKIRLDPALLEKAKKVAPAAPLNAIGHMRTLATADDVLPYTPNNDTVYSGALLELADEPISLTATGRSRSPTTSIRGSPASAEP